LLAALAAAAPPPPIRVLLLSGQNNHDWKATTPEIERVLAAGGRFSVEVTEHPEQIDAAALKRFDVVLSNWNCFHRDTPPPVIEWPAEVRAAYESFVRDGGGFAVVHAGGSSFYKHPWPAYEEMVIARYGFGQTAHGVQHVFSVQIAEPEHPITRGMADFMSHDELWHRPLVAEGATVLARVFSAAEEGGSGAYEPSAFVRNFGKGRCFTTLLGHGLRGLRNPAFGALLRRGVEWAATGEVTIPLPDAWPTTTNAVEALHMPLDDAIAATRDWKLGDNPAPLRVVAGAVSAAEEPERAALADQLAQALRSSNSPAGRRLLCDELGRVGGSSHVEAISPLLADAQTRVAARTALERIGGPAAAQALADAATAAPPDPTAEAEAALARADAARARGEFADASRLYDEVIQQAASPAIVRAATVGRLLCAAAQSPNALADALRSDDPVAADAALQAIRVSRAAPHLAVLLSHLPALPAARQAQAIHLLAECNARGAAQPLAALVGAGAPEVRPAAIDALATLGGAEIVPALLHAAESAEGPLATALVDSLAAIADPGVDEPLIVAITGASPKSAAVAAEALAARGGTAGLPALHVRAVKLDGASAAAIKAIGDLGAAADAAPLLDLLAQAPPDALRVELRSAVVHIAQRHSDDTCAHVIGRLPSAPESASPDLLEILGAIGGPQALQAVCGSLASPAAPVRLAAFRTLSNWTDAAALEPLAAALTDESDERLRTLAIRGLARLLPRAGDLPAGERAALFDRAAAEARTPAECKTLLGCVAAAPTARTLAWALAQREAPETRREAGAAVLVLCDALAETEPDRVAGALRCLLDDADDPAGRAGALRRLARSGAMRNLARDASADSPDGLSPDFGGREAPAAIDGDVATYWDEDNGRSLYRIALKFPEPATISVMALTGYRQHYAAPHTFTILRDGAPHHSVSNLEYADNVALVEFPRAAFTTLTLEITGYYGPSPGIRELELYDPQQKADAGFGWRRSLDALELTHDGRTVWAFHFGDGVAKPYFHPLALPGGEPLTWNAPADHLWHHGLWFSWKFINGVNYWEEDRASGRSDGLTHIRRVVADAHDDFSATLTLTLEYAPRDGSPVLAEQRVIRVSAPAADGGYHIDWNADFTALADVVLDRTPLPHEPGGKVYGGYGGLAFRFAESIEIAEMLTPDGPITEWKDERHRSRAPGLAVNGAIADRAVGVAILDHPANLNAPTPWYAIRSSPMRYVNPAVVCFGPKSIEKGGKFSLHYRLHLRPAHWTPESLRSAIEQYAAQAKTQAPAHEGSP